MGESFSYFQVTNVKLINEMSVNVREPLEVDITP